MERVNQRTLIVLLGVLALSACSKQQVVPHEELLGQWEYDIGRTMRGFLQVAGPGALLLQGRKEELVDAYKRQAQQLNLKTTLVIRPARIEISSPFGFRKLSYSVLSQQDNIYTLQATYEDGSQREVVLRKLNEIDAIALQSRDCRDLPSGCEPIRTAIAEKFGLDLPAKRKQPILAPGDATRPISSDDCGQSESPCAGSGELFKSVRPKWLYYVRSDLAVLE